MDRPPDEARDKKREAWTARGQLLLHFHDVISRAIRNPSFKHKCDQIGAAMEMQSTLSKEYEAETNLIVENKAKRDSVVRNKSLAVGAFAFVSLRTGRGLSSWLRRSIANRSSAYQFDIPSSTGQRAQIMSKINDNIDQPSKLRRFGRFATDTIISSSLVFLSGTLFLPPPASYIKDMADLPLVSGKSVYAEYICPPLIRSFETKRGGKWPVPSSGVRTKEDVSLDIIRSFAVNCLQRKKFEDALGDELNALSLKGRGSKLGTVSVPEPGVPDIPIDLEGEIEKEIESLLGGGKRRQES